MKGTSALAMTALLAMASLCGCSSLAEGRRYFAEAGGQICRHCNCYMPAHYDPADYCAVCDCGYTHAECIR